MTTETQLHETTAEERCAEGCCDPANQPGFFNRYTGGVAFFQALSS
jgi:hypothetical protein